MRPTRTSLVLLVALLSATGLTASAHAGQKQGKVIQCGEWRWPVKTLSDKLESKVNFFPRNRAVAFLRGLKAPSHLTNSTPRQKGWSEPPTGSRPRSFGPPSRTTTTSIWWLRHPPTVPRR